LAACLLFPFSLAFRFLAAIRRIAYRSGLLRRERLPVPVVIVGNITVGGTGKTPLVIHLARALSEQGRRPGIISRGYGGGAVNPTEVKRDGDATVVGDEALVLARHCGCPVFVGCDRVSAGRAMLSVYPECDVILADDGLQHYRLVRDVELAVFDVRGLMNGWVLPAGPLRETLSRLATVDAVILHENAVAPAPTFSRPVFSMRLVGAGFGLLNDPAQTCTAEDLTGLRLHAVAGIGAPGRFFDHLRAMNLDFVEHPFPDHHRYAASDLQFVGDAILTTEKDAVKLGALRLSMPVWVLPVAAHVNPDLGSFVLEKLNGCPPA
jgi:tetraacyldisaccharide 4'-kinase